MQKKIIALAIAGLASSAVFAQTNVTVYGVADLGEAFVKSSGGRSSASNQHSVSRLDSNSSYIGFKGIEDLGNGLKAVFQFESAVAPDTASGLSGGRDSYVGLAGPFGTVAAGTLTHPLRAFGAKAELMPGAAGFGTMASVTGTLAGVKTGADDRANNAIAYISPNMGGFTGTVAYINGENKTNATPTTLAINSHQYQIAGQYENGPLFVGLGYHKSVDLGQSFADAASTALTGATGNVAPTVDARVIRLAASYTLPSKTKFVGLVDRTKVEDSGSIRRLAWQLGVAQGFGANTIGLEYGASGKLKNNDGIEMNNSKSHIVSAVYSYDLSKRTMLHARLSRLSNQGAINNNFYLNPVNNGAITTAGSDYTGAMVGIRHSF